MRYLYLAIVVLVYSCNTGDQNNTSTTPTDSEKTIIRTDTVYLVRNTLITPANSYSDLFLDSMAVEQFIASKKMEDIDAKSFRSFYNYRNLEFAWFTSLGFTE